MDKQAKIGDLIKIKCWTPYVNLVGQVLTVHSLTALDGDVFVRVDDVNYYLYKSEYEIMEVQD